MGEKDFRNKIYWLTFLFSILVIWVHSYNSELFLGKTPINVRVSKIEYFFGTTVAQIAVPGFFLISSYLFYRNFSWGKLLGKWESRIRSVLVPYIVWNAVYYLGYLIASRVPVLTEVVGRGSILFSLEILTDAVLKYAYNPVFWYLYQLILLILLAPAIYGILYNRWIGAVFLAFLMAGLHYKVRLLPLNLDALFYYSSGAYLALHASEISEAEWSLRRFSAGSAVLVFSVYLHFFLFKEAWVLSTVLYRLLVPVCLWLIINEKRLCSAREWMTENFFLYAAHFALVRFINKTGAMIFPPAPAVPLLIYFTMPVLTIIVCFWTGRLMKKHMHPVWRLLNGSR